MLFSVVRTPIDTDTRHHSCRYVRLVSPQQFLTTVMTRIVVDKSTDNISICFVCASTKL